MPMMMAMRPVMTMVMMRARRHHDRRGLQRSDHAAAQGGGEGENH
jgi:hypothetical protein